MPQTRIGLAGLGVVGSEVAKWLQHNPEFSLTAVAARDPQKIRKIDLGSSVAWCDVTTLATRDDVDIVVELMGGADGAALDLAQSAIRTKKPLVTANKAMLAKHWDSLNPTQNKIYFEAAVAGGIPIIASLRQSLAANKIYKISGILNGTCNFMLTRMGRDGLDYKAALQEAQAKGYAEADPTFDVGGWDSAHKLYVLARLAGAAIELSDINVQGIDRLDLPYVQQAFARGGAMRLVAEADFDTNRFTVAPQIVSADHPLASVDGVLNAVMVVGDMMPSLTLIGAGAGGKPTASAVCADILSAANLN